MKLVKDDNYQRKERLFFKKYAHLVNKYANVLTTLKINPFDSSLKTHKLKGELKELYSCSLTHDYRSICIFFIHDETVVLVDIGSHDRVN